MTLLLSTFIGLAAAASLFVILLFTQAPATGVGGGLPSLQQLARPNGLITRIVPGTAKWLPGTALDTVASGGGEGVSYAHGLIVAAVYLIAATAATAVTFTRRDVTA